MSTKPRSVLTLAAICLTGGWLAVAPLPAQCAASTPRITVLYDAFGKAPDMTKDCGFSALIEYDGKRILFDTGNNAEIFAHNVKARGIDLTRLDFAIVSHRHGDHTSGLNYLLTVNPRVKIYVPKENFGDLLPATRGEIRRIAVALHDEWKVAWIAPSHCTGEPAFAILHEVFGDRYVYAGLGAMLIVGNTVTSTTASAAAPTRQGLDEDDLRSYREQLARSGDLPESWLAQASQARVTATAPVVRAAASHRRHW